MEFGAVNAIASLAIAGGMYAAVLLVGWGVAKAYGHWWPE